MVDMVFEELLSDKSLIEKCHFLGSHPIRHDQKSEEISARQIHNIYQSPCTGTTKNARIKTDLAPLMSYDFKTHLVQMMSSKLQYSLKLKRMMLPVEAKKWLLNEQKCQQ
jgi:hypothetical protein